MVNGKDKGKIIVFGFIFGYPFAGVTYQFLHYLLGLKRLGYDPYYIEDSARRVYNPKLNDMSYDVSRNISSVVPVLEAHGFSKRWAFRSNYPTKQCYGMTESRILQLYKEADAFLNVTGSQEIREEHMTCPRRVYVESDPFASQVRVVKGDEFMIATLKAHDVLFTFAENIGAPDCDIPENQFQWLPTRQPVVMDLWDNPYGFEGNTYNTITTWSNKGKCIDYQGETYYWTKDREFEKFLNLPKQRKVPFELAMGVDETLWRRLGSYGWQQINSIEVSKNTDKYQEYIQQSRGEFTVARDQYTRPNTGWFSDRSSCYLAAGRPVITQETGFSKFLPTGNGLFAFKTMDDVLAAVDAIESDYHGNCRAAKEIAAEYFTAEKVIGSLMERADL